MVPSEKAPMHFKTMKQLDVPQGRHGKHREIVSLILRDLDQLAKGAALRIPVAELPDTKANIRSALSRATRKQGRNVATATDDTYLYIWNVTE